MHGHGNQYIFQVVYIKLHIK